MSEFKIPHPKSMRVDGLYLVWDELFGIRAEAEIKGERVPVAISMPRTSLTSAILRSANERNSLLTTSKPTEK